MKVEVNYTKNVTCCKECPYYFQDCDMGAIIPICTKGKIILPSPNIIPDDCPIKLDCSHKEESQKPKRTLEELGITEDKYYIVGRKNH